MRATKKKTKLTLEQAKAKVAAMEYDVVKAVLRSHGVDLWLDHESIVRSLLAEKIECGEIADPTITSDTIIKN